MNTAAVVAGYVWMGLALLVIAFGVVVVCVEAWHPKRKPSNVTPLRQSSHVRIVVPEQNGEVVELHPAGTPSDVA